MFWQKNFLKWISIFTFVNLINYAALIEIRADPIDVGNLLEKAGISGGLIVHVGCDNGEWTSNFYINDRYLVHGLDTNANEITQARHYLKSLDLYGKVSVEHWQGYRLPYADNLVNLLIVDEMGDLSREEIMRVLVPQGIAYYKDGNTWNQIIKQKQNEIDEWTHYLHGPDNNAVAQDKRVMPPKRMQWKNGPMWCRSHEFASSITCLVTAKGRIFFIVDEGIIGQPRGVPPQWRLVARDAFNGKLLWKRDVSQGQTLQRLLVADGELVYTSLGNEKPVSVLDGPTGKILRTFKDTDHAQEMVVDQGMAIIYLHNKTLARRSKQNGKSIIVFDGKTGQELWKKSVKEVRDESLATKNGYVYYHNGNEIVTLNLEDGEEKWRASCNSGQHLLIYNGSVIVSARNGLQGFDAESGKHLWSGPRSGEDLFGAQNLIWVDVSHSPGRNVAWASFPFVCVGLDPRTGEEKKRLSVKNILSPGHHPRCYRGKATERFILQNKRGVEFVDLMDDTHMRQDWLRASCRHGFVPANGLLYMPPHQCFCYGGVILTGFNVMSGYDLKHSWKAIPDNQRLVQGSAWNSLKVQEDIGEEEWSHYRHDAQRSGSVRSEVPVQLTHLWETKLDGPLTQPVAADGRIFVACEDTHTIYALDAKSGEPYWEFTADGRIDSSPTLYKGLILFGSSDGRVYCLRASDGQLVWRFQAAPYERRIMAFDQLESAWPVHGSVVVQNNKVYFTAGHSSYLDGGIYAYALDPQSGEILHKTRIKSDPPDVNNDIGRPFDMEGTRTDILVSDGEDLYMYHERLGPDLTRKEMKRVTRMGDYDVGLHLMCNDGFLDKTWFNRSYWTYSRRWPGFYFSYRGSKSGQILVFDEARVYGVKVFTKRHGHSPEYTIGSGYELFADAVNTEPVLLPHAIGRDKSEGFSRSAPKIWSTKIPIRVKAMVLAGQRLFLAGPPDIAPEQDPLAAFEGRQGSRLWVVSADDGERLHEYEMKTMPAFDGMIATDGRLYIVTEDHKIICLGQK